MAAKRAKVIMTEIDMGHCLNRIAHEIIEVNRGAANVVLIGILNRGLPLARRLAKIIEQTTKVKVPVGGLDVSLYRDDLAKKGAFIDVRKSEIPFSVNNKIVVLVDDVIYAGRTARAALDGLKDYGRADKIQLASLVDRGNRELPIHPNYVGKIVPSAKDEKVQVELLEVDGVDRVIIK